MINWHQYNEKLVRRGEILISADVLQGWGKELCQMNRKKEGRDIIIAIDSTGIKVRKNSSGKSSGCYPRKVSVISQLANYQYWKDSVSYGKRWIVESVFSVLKRIFGEHVMVHKRQNMIQELGLKVALYNRFMSM